jgi:hypothetical protein
MVVVRGAEKEFLVSGKKVDAQDARFAGAASVVSLVMDKIMHERGGMIILDSWDSIAKEMDRMERLKTEKTLAAIAESNDSKLGFVSEEPTLTTTDYLVDAIVELDSKVHQSAIRRTLEIKKLRGQAISHPVRLFTLNEGRFMICPGTVAKFPGHYEARQFQRIPNSKAWLSTGIGDLDSMLRGGFSPGSSLCFEYGEGVSTNSIEPLNHAILANFLANDGCIVSIPASGVPPRVILDSLRSFLSEEVVNSRVRLGYYEKYEDPCVFQLDAASVDVTFAKLWQIIDWLKGHNHRACFVSIGVEHLEYVHGTQNFLKHIVISMTRIKHNMDVIATTVNETTAVKSAISAVSDLHLMFETEGNTLTVQGLKPAENISAINYDYSGGYPRITLMPVT